MVDPVAVLGLLLILWLLYQLLRMIRGRKIAWGSFVAGCLLLALLVFVSAPAVVNPLVAKLEDQNPANPSCAQSELPIVVAAGGIDSRAKSIDQIQFLSAATMTRSIEAWQLLGQQSSNVPVFLSGGGRRGVTEAETMQRLLERLGVEKTRLVAETRSWSTGSSAKYTRSLFDDQGLAAEIRLVTSAMHMVRAKASFEAVGFTVCPVSVDQQAIPSIPWYTLLPQISAMVKFDMLLHEVVGLLRYRMTGEIAGQ